MELSFAAKRKAKLCNSKVEMRSKLGLRCAERLQQRLEELRAAATLEDMRFLPGARCHELKQQRKQQLAVDLVHPRRLVFEPADDPVPTKADGGLDWSQVTRIVVLEVVDYH